MAFVSTPRGRSHTSTYMSVSTTDNGLRKYLRVKEEHELLLEGKPMELHQRQTQLELKGGNVRFQQDTSVQNFTQDLHFTRTQSPYQAPKARTNKNQEGKKIVRNFDEDVIHTLARDQELARQKLRDRRAVSGFQKEQMWQKNELIEKEKLMKKKEEQERTKLWKETLAQKVRYQKEKMPQVKKQLLKEQLEANAVRAQQRELQKQKEAADYEQSLLLQAEVDRKMAITMAHTMNKVRQRQINAEREANKLAPQKEQAAKMALKKENLSIEQFLRKQDEEAQKRRIKEESDKAARLLSVHEGRQKAIRMKEERKQAEQRKEQEWADFDRKAHMMHVLHRQEVAQKVRQKNIEVSKANLAMAKESRARAELEKRSQREWCLLETQRQSAEKPYWHDDTASQLNVAHENLPTLHTNVGRHSLLLHGKCPNCMCPNCLNIKSQAPLPKIAPGRTHFNQYEEHAGRQQVKAGVKGQARKTSGIKDLPGNAKLVTTLPANNQRLPKPAPLPHISKRKYIPVPPYVPRLI